MTDFVRIKSWFAILLSVLLVLGTACSDDGDDDQTPDASVSDASTSDVEGDASQDVADDGGDASGEGAVGEPCPDSCGMAERSPAMVGRCEACSHDYCYGYAEGSYCVQRCETDEDCANLGDAWFCRLSSCLHEDRW